MEGTRYVVKQNDTLWDLSSRFLGDPNKWPIIYKHNNSDPIVKLTGTSIPEEDIIHVGQVLYIPEKGVTPVTHPGKPIRYAHFKSKAKQYEKYKDSIFLKGIAAPVTKVRMDQISSIKYDARTEREYALRVLLARRLSNEEVKRFFSRLDAIPELVGAGVAYMDRRFTIAKIRPSIRQDRLVVLLREVNQYDTLISLANRNSNNRVVSELLYAGLSCTGAALGYVALTAEGFAVPVTAGTSSLLIPITTGATLASSASCGVYTGRVINELSGNSDYNSYLDDNVAFGYVMNALDVASLFGLAGTIKSNTTMIKLFTNKSMSRQTLFQRWKAMPRADRKKLIKELIKLDNPEIKPKQLKAVIRSMDRPKVFSQLEIRKAMAREVVSAAASAFSTSASAADGVLNSLAIAFIADERKD